MTENIRISAKVLGGMALPDYCPRCFWIKLHTKKLPWQIFPGIFSSIDAYTKKAVRVMIDNDSVLQPSWIHAMRVVGYVDKVPNWRTFYMETRFGITLTGVPDDIFLTDNGQDIIPDHKTAKFTKNQDKLLPMYEIQLNGYAKIHENQTKRRIRALPLMYWQPQTEQRDAEYATGPDGFYMNFKPYIHMVPRDISKVDVLLEQARALYDNPIPDHNEDCEDCRLLAAIPR